MTYRVISSNQVNSILVQEDDIIVQPDGRFYSSTFDTFSTATPLGDLHLMLNGESFAGDNILDMQPGETADSLRVDIGVTGQLTSVEAAFVLTGTLGELQINNQGSITAGSLGVVYYTRGNAFITNTGSMTSIGDTLGVIALGTHATGNLYTTTSRIVNTGTIIQTDVMSPAYAITVQDGLLMDIVNSGLIDGGDTAITSETRLSRVTNTGQIVGTVRLEESLDSVQSTQIGVINNSGEMDNLLSQDIEALFVRNSGIMDSVFASEARNVSMTNTGTLTQRVTLAAEGGEVADGTEISFANHGIIALGSDSGNFVDLRAGDISFVNTGEIGGAVYLGVSESKVSTVYAQNTGTITAAFGAVGLTVKAGEDAQVINRGTIIGGVAFERAFDVFMGARFVNTGEVLNSLGRALYILDVYSNAEVFNSGTMTGDVVLEADVVTLTNSGVIDGDVMFGFSADTYRATATGVVTGTVYGEIGNDTLIGGARDDRFDGGDQNDLIRLQGGDDRGAGGAGNDTLNGGDGNDTLLGDDGSDQMSGGSGDDLMLGGAGIDRLSGNDGADNINAGDGNDSVFGGNDDDTLNGGAGDDRIFGGAGVNLFIGGDGRDVMYAQEGEDTFTFYTASESAVGGQRDVITGYDVGQDIIDLAAVAPGVLDYIGTAAFTGTAREVRIVEYASGSTVVQVDTDGNGTQDMEIMVYLVTGLSELDFVL